MMMRILIPIATCVAAAVLSAGAVPTPADAATPKKTAAPKNIDVPLEYIADIEAWHDKLETSLRRDNGWLTLAGRFVIKPGVNTFGSGQDNDIVFPPELKSIGPARLGTITVTTGKVILNLADGVNMSSEAGTFSGQRELKPASHTRDWVSLGRIAMHVIERNGTYVLRLADNESAVRKNFAGRIWYEPAPQFLVDAKFVPYPPGKTIPIINIIDEVADEPSPGYVEFKLKDKRHRLDAISDEGGLFFVFRDATAGVTTYRPSRFLFVEVMPAPNSVFKLDFNKAYNPPCAFSEFTTCPLPPKQNIISSKIEAGEKYRKKY